MNNGKWLLFTAVILFAIACFPEPAEAYVGPGTGMSAVGVFLAIVMGLIVAVFGFLWYPVKRLMRMYKKRIGGKGEQHV